MYLGKPFYLIDEFINLINQDGLNANINDIIDWSKQEHLLLSAAIDPQKLLRSHNISIYSTRDYYTVDILNEPIDNNYYAEAEYNDSHEFDQVYYYKQLFPNNSDPSGKRIELFPRLPKNNYNLSYFAFVPPSKLRFHDEDDPNPYWIFTDSLIFKSLKVDKVSNPEFYFLRSDNLGFNYDPIELILCSNKLESPVVINAEFIQLQLFITIDIASAFIESNAYKEFVIKIKHRSNYTQLINQDKNFKDSY